MLWMLIVFAYPLRQNKNSNGEVYTVRQIIATMKKSLINKLYRHKRTRNCIAII